MKLKNKLQSFNSVLLFCLEDSADEDEDDADENAEEEDGENKVCM